MLCEVGFQFKRDVVLQDSINGTNTSLSNLNGLNLDAKTKADLTKTLNGLINQWTNEQNNITKKYGK